MPVVDAAVEEVDAIEERLLQGQLARADIERIYELRRELVRLRRVSAPMVEVCSRLRHVELPFIDKNMRPISRTCSTTWSGSTRPSTVCARC